MLHTAFPVDRRGRYPRTHQEDASSESDRSSASSLPAPIRHPTFSFSSDDDDDDDDDDGTIEFARSAMHPTAMRHLDEWDVAQRSPTPVHHARASHLGGKQQQQRARDPSYGDVSGASPGSTMGHHASRMTLGAGGLFTRSGKENRGYGGDNDDDNDEYDPERDIAKLVRGIDDLVPARSNIFAKTSPPKQQKSAAPTTHRQAHLAAPPSHRHRPVQPSPLRSLVIPSPDPSIARSKSTSRDETAHKDRYRARVEDATDEGTHRKTKSPPTSSPTPTPPPPPPARAPSPRRDVSWADMTRLTGMLATPRKGDAHGSVPEDGARDAAPGYIHDSLKDAVARMDALQDETALARRRIRELEADLERVRAEAARDRQRADEVEQRHAGSESEKKELEKLVVVLRREVAKITHDWHAEMDRARKLQARLEAVPATGLDAMMHALLQRINHLEGEVGKLRSVVERAVELKDVTFDDSRAAVSKDETFDARPKPNVDPKPTQYQEGLVAAAYDSPVHTVKPLTPPPSDEERPRRRKARSHGAHPPHAARSDEPQEDPATSPFPAIRGERLEKEFFSPKVHVPIPASATRKQALSPTQPTATEAQAAVTSAQGLDHALRNNDAPPQTLVMSVLREIEQDYEHYLAIYTDLAEQYKRTSPLSVKRNILAEHLKQVIDTIELKANQVARLTQVLQVKDKLYTAPIIKAAQASRARMSVPETVRAVRKDLGMSIVSTPLPKRRHEHAIV